MTAYQSVTDSLVRQCAALLGEELVGIYLHGSAAMGCFDARRSDIDLMIVVRDEMNGQIKRQLMDVIVDCNSRGPAKGIELSVVKRAVCDPFVYPTPFELHFSVTHLDWYRTDPQDYVERMNGTDRDLAAHFTIIRRRGITLYGAPITQVFGEVESACYFDSLLYDVENAQEDILRDPVYVTLNLCRILAYKRGGLILSKQEGAEWGLANLPQDWLEPVRQAERAYRLVEPIQTTAQATMFAAWMLAQIRGD